MRSWTVLKYHEVIALANLCERMKGSGMSEPHIPCYVM